MGCGASKNAEPNMQIIHDAVFVDARAGDTIIRRSKDKIEEEEETGKPSETKPWGDSKGTEATTSDVYVVEFKPSPQNVAITGSLDMPSSSSEEQSSNLTIRNNEKETVFFKMKVTDPEALTASPKEGSVKPGEFKNVKIRYRPKMTVEFEDTSRLKVMVEAVICDFMEGEVLPYHAWRQAPSKSVFRQKIQVSFVEELALEKFMSVKMSATVEDDSLWWK